MTNTLVRDGVISYLFCSLAKRLAVINEETEKWTFPPTRILMGK
jgi:hypothetical protein